MDSVSAIARQMPFSNEAVQALIGAVILKPEAYDHIGAMITASDFYLDDHKKIFAAITEMYMQSRVIDLVTLVNALKESMGKSESNITTYLATLINSVPSASNVKEYINKNNKLVKVVEEKRELFKTDSSEADSAYIEPVKTLAPVEDDD